MICWGDGGTEDGEVEKKIAVAALCIRSIDGIEEAAPPVCGSALPPFIGERGQELRAIVVRSAEHVLRRQLPDGCAPGPSISRRQSLLSTPVHLAASCS